MPKLIADVQAIKEADAADLVHTYNQLTGKSVKKFENRTIAERRVEMALLAAKDADAKTGLPKGSEPQPQPRVEILRKAAARGTEPPPALDADNADPVFQPGTMAYELDKAARNAQPIPKREPREKKAPADKKVLYAVVATFAGTSKPQTGSLRNNVLLRIQGSPKGAATIESLDAHFGINTRGYVAKLLERDHLRLLTEIEYAALPARNPARPAAEKIAA